MKQENNQSVTTNISYTDKEALNDDLINLEIYETDQYSWVELRVTTKSRVIQFLEKVESLLPPVSQEETYEYDDDMPLAKALTNESIGIRQSTMESLQTCIKEPNMKSLDERRWDTLSSRRVGLKESSTIMDFLSGDSLSTLMKDFSMD